MNARRGMSAIMVLPHGQGHRRRSQRRLQAFGLVLGMPKASSLHFNSRSFGMSVGSSRNKATPFPWEMWALLHFGTKGYLAAELQCPLLGVKRTSELSESMSAFDPFRLFAGSNCCAA